MNVNRAVRANSRNAIGELHGLEIGAVALYNEAIRIAREEGDNASRELFERLLKDEEEHVDWLEAQVYQIQELGYERYLSQQIREEK